MELLALWLFFAVLVGIAASSRGRNGFGWFLLACIISPLLAGLLVIATPNRRHENLLEKIAASSQRGPAGETRIPAPFGGRASRVTLTPAPFQADGVFAGVPYKVTSHGAVDAVVQGAVVRFADFEQFTKAFGPPANSA